MLKYTQYLFCRVVLSAQFGDFAKGLGIFWWEIQIVARQFKFLAGNSNCGTTIQFLAGNSKFSMIFSAKFKFSAFFRRFLLRISCRRTWPDYTFLTHFLANPAGPGAPKNQPGPARLTPPPGRPGPPGRVGPCRPLRHPVLKKCRIHSIFAEIPMNSPRLFQIP